MKKSSDEDSNARSPFLGNREPIDDPTPAAEIDDTSPHPYGAVGKTLVRWQALDHPPVELQSRTYITVVIALIAIIAYAIYTDSPLMAIVFILVGTVGYLSLNQEPEMILYSITTKGIIVFKEFYEYGHIRSFWIIENDSNEHEELVLETGGTLISHVFIPLQGQKADTIRDILREHLPEKKYLPGLIDTLAKILHI